MKAVVLFVTAIFLHVAAPSPHGISSWNNLLGAHGIFPTELDFLQGHSSTTPTDVLLQLNNFLADPTKLRGLYSNFRTLFGKSNPFQGHRLEIFRQKLIKIAEHNLKFYSGQVTWRKGINLFSDLTSEEFTASYTGYATPGSGTHKFDNVTSNSVSEAPESYDWRHENIITPCKQQGECASCTLFSVNSLVEAATARRTGKIIDLSEQELVDCPSPNAEGKGTGCQGNWYPPILDYLKKKGVTKEELYPYEGVDNVCRARKKERAARLKSYGSVPGDEKAWPDTLVEYGPLGGSLWAGGDWQDYSGGIFTGECGQQKDAHAVNIIGYGSQEDGDYWIIKNSWGESWGEDGGFMKLPRGENKCSIQDSEVYYITSL